MLLRSKQVSKNFYDLKRKITAILKTAPVFASFSVDFENGIISVMLRNRDDLPLDSRQFIQGFDPNELKNDEDGSLVNELVDCVVSYIRGASPKFKYTFEWEEDPSKEDLVKLEDFSSLETVKVVKEKTRSMVLTKLFIKKDFFIAMDEDDPEFTCGFSCNSSSIDFLMKLYSGEIPEDSIPDYLDFVLKKE